MSNIKQDLRDLSDCHVKPYRIGDAIKGTWWLTGTLTAAANDIHFSIPIAKPAVGCTGCVLSGKLSVRQNGYLAQDEDIQAFDLSSNFIDKDILHVILSKSKGFNGVNNSPVSVHITGTLKFV